MTLRNSQLREFSRCKDLEEEGTHTAPPNISQTYPSRQSEVIKSLIKQREHLEKKRKRGETFKFQGHDDQIATDSARVTNMDNLCFSEDFSNITYTSDNTYAYGDHFHDTGSSGAFHDMDYDCTFYDHRMPASSDVPWNLPGDTEVPGSFVLGTLADGRPSYHGSTDEIRAGIKREDAHDANTTSAAPEESSDFSVGESEEECPRKTLKINKDGAPRKPRQPRPKLLKWSDDDWKNVCLGIVWACGETGLQIPFDQAAQVVGEKCTAGALQQALLKLRGKQIAEGHQIPNLKMAWTRKNRYATPSTKSKPSQEPEANRPRKKPTHMEGTQSCLITLPRAYNDHDRQLMAYPYKWKKSPCKASFSMLRGSANIGQECSAEASTSSSSFIHDLPQHQNALSSYTYAHLGMAQTTHPSFGTSRAQTHLHGNVTHSRTLTPNRDEGIQGDTTVYDYVHWFDNPETLAISQGPDYPPATPIAGQQPYNSPPATPFGKNTGYLQGMVVSGEELASLITEGLHK